MFTSIRFFKIFFLVFLMFIAITSGKSQAETLNNVTPSYEMQLSVSKIDKTMGFAFANLLLTFLVPSGNELVCYPIPFDVKGSTRTYVESGQPNDVFWGSTNYEKSFSIFIVKQTEQLNKVEITSERLRLPLELSHKSKSGYSIPIPVPLIPVVAKEACQGMLFGNFAKFEIHYKFLDDIITGSGKHIGRGEKDKGLYFTSDDNINENVIVLFSNPPPKRYIIYFFIAGIVFFLSLTIDQSKLGVPKHPIRWLVFCFFALLLILILFILRYIDIEYFLTDTTAIAIGSSFIAAIILIITAALKEIFTRRRLPPPFIFRQ